MSNTIRIKRRISGSPGAPASLFNAELAFNEVDGTLFYGKGDNGSGLATEVIAIGGAGLNGEFVTLNTTQVISGDKTFSGPVAFTGDVDFVQAGVSGLNLHQMEDVDLNPETPPSAGQVLTWDDNEFKWVAGDVPRDSITSIIAAPGTGISVTEDGAGNVTISGIDATTTVKGVVRFANALEVSEGVATDVVVSPANVAGLISDAAYELPPATETELGGIKVGTGLAVTADGTLSTNIEGALVYRGTADVRTTAPAASQGDVYINEPETGTADDSWTGIAGQTIAVNALLLFDGTDWEAIDIANVAVTEITGIDPIVVNSTVQTKPEISVKSATTEQIGVVELATAQEVVDGTAGVVPTADQVKGLYDSVNNRLPDGTANGDVLSWNSSTQAWVAGILDGGVF